MTNPWHEDLWRARALRYTLLYLLLACVLVGLRYQTRDVYPDLKELRTERNLLMQQKQALDLEVQKQTSTARVREWALGNGMIPFSNARKESAEFQPLPSPDPLLPNQPLEVHTRWK